MSRPNSDRDRTPLVVVLFDLLNLLTKPNKMAAQHFLSVWRQSRGTFPEFQIIRTAWAVEAQTVRTTCSMKCTVSSCQGQFHLPPRHFLRCSSLAGSYECSSHVWRLSGNHKANEPRAGGTSLTLSRCSSCISFTIKIMSKRDSIVVWKSIFYDGIRMRQ
jgi:hypothetical protein